MTRGNSDERGHQTGHSRSGGDDPTGWPRAAGAVARLAATALVVLKVAVAYIRQAVGEVRTWRTPRLAAAGAVIAATVLVPVSITTSNLGDAVSASASSPANFGSTLFQQATVQAASAGASTDTGPLSTSETVTTTADTLCGSPTTSGSLIGEGSEVCYQITVKDAGTTTTAATGATLDLEFVDSSGNASTEEQFRTQSLKSSGGTTQVAAPSQVIGWGNAFDITATDTGSGDTATETGGSATPTPTGSGLNSLSLSLGKEDASGPYTIDVAGVMNDGVSSPAAVYLAATLSYSYTPSGGTATNATSTCDQSGCAASVTPAVPSLDVQKAITTTLPSNTGQSGDQIGYQVTITNQSSVTGYDLGFCDSLAASTGLSSGTHATYTYTPVSGTGVSSAEASSIPACPSPGPGGTLQNIPGGQTINLAPGDKEVITYTLTLTLPVPSSSSCTVTGVNFCNSGTGEWQSTASTVSSDVTSPPTPVVSYTSGGASLDEVNGPTLGDSVAATVASGDPAFDAATDYAVVPGETLTYTLKVGVPPTGLKSFTVQDTLPSGLDASTVTGTGVVGSLPSGNSSSQSSALSTAATSPSTTASVVTFTFPTIENSGSSAASFNFAFTVKAGGYASASAADQAEMAWTSPAGTTHSMGSDMASAQAVQVVLLPKMTVTRLSGTGASGFDASCTTASGVEIPEGTEVCYQVVVNPQSETVGSSGSPASLTLSFQSSDSTVREQFDTQTVGTTSDVPAPFSQTGTSNDGTVSADGKKVTGNAPGAVSSGTLTLNLGTISASVPATIDVAGVLSGAAITASSLASVNISAALTSSYTFPGGTSTTAFNPTGQDTPAVTPTAPTVSVSKLITNDSSATAITGDQVSYQVTVTNTSPSTDTATAYDLGFCDSLAASTGLSSGTHAIYTYTPVSGTGVISATASSIPACPSPGPGGTLQNIPGGQTINLAPGDKEVITYTLTMPGLSSTTICSGQTLDNFCNSGVAEWQIPAQMPSTTTADPTGDTLTPYTSGTASLVIQSKPTVTANADVSTGSSVTIGQQINYHYTIPVPPGGLQSVKAVVSLPEGIGVATSSDTPPKVLGASVDSSSASAYQSSSAIANAVTNATVASTTSSDPSAVDNQVTFDLGNLANTSTNGEDLQIDFPAWVLNEASNAGSPPAASATTLNSIGGGQSTNVAVSYVTTQTHTSSATLPTYTVIEPAVTVAQTVAPQGETSLPPVVDVNDHLLITDTVTNTGAAEGYDVVVDTAIPAGFSDATLVSPTTGVTTQGSPPSGDFGFVIPTLAAAQSETVTWTILADRPTTLGTGTTGTLGAPASAWQSLAAAPSAPTGNTDTDIAYRTSTKTGSTADVGLTSPDVTTPGASTTSMQIGQRFTYSVSFVVPATGADSVVLTSTLAPGLGYALDSSKNVTCTSGATVSNAGCITVQAINGGPSLNNAATVDAEALPELSGGNLVVHLGNLTYPTPTSALVSNPTPTAEVTVSYDVYVTDSSANAKSANVTISSPDTVGVTYQTVPGGAASTSPLEAVAAAVTVDNPALTAPSVSVSPAHAEVGVVNPGPALVQVTADVSAPSEYTAYGATLTVTLPSGLLAVNGLAETGVSGALATPGCTGGGGSCVTGQAATGSTVTYFTKGLQPPTTCTSSDPATAGSTVVAYLPVLAASDTQMQLTFDACVVPGTTFGTGSAQTLNDSVSWYSQPPPPPLAPPAGTGSLAAHAYGPESATASVDYTGTSVNMALAATNDGNSSGFTIGDTVGYTVTVGLPEAADPSVSPPATPTSPVTLPAYSVCLFLPAGLTFVNAPAATASQIGAGIVSTTVHQPTVATSGFSDANCPPQLAAQPKGTTLVELDYPAGTQVYYNGLYAGDSFDQTVNVTVGPDPAAATANIARGTTETPAASVGVVNRSQTEPVASNSFTVTEPELKFTSAVPASANQGTNGVLAAVAITNDNTDGLAAPAYNDHVLISTPASATLNLTPGTAYEMSQSKEASLIAGDPKDNGSLSTFLLTPADLAELSPIPSTAPDAWTGKATKSTSGTGNNTIDFTSADPAPGNVVVLTFSFDVTPLALNATSIPVNTSLVNATSQPGTTPGRTYSSTGTGPALVAPSSAALTVSGPSAALSVTLTGPTTVAPGASPTYAVKVTNDGPDAVKGANLQVSVSPALTNMLITPPANTSGNGSYDQVTGAWDVSIPSGSSATLDVTGSIPQTASGSLSVKATATTSPQTTGVAQIINKTDPGTASLTANLQVAVDASVQIAAQGKLYSGQTATYVTTVSNAGPSAAGNITLTVTPPAGTGFVDSSGSGWTCGKAFPLTCTFAGPLSPNKSTQVTTDLVIDQPTGSTITVQAHAATANDTNPSNDTATSSGTVLAALISSAASSGSQQSTTASAQPQTVSSSSGSSSTPALAFTGDNEAGQTGLGLIVLAAGLVLLLASRWRRRPAQAAASGAAGDPQAGAGAHGQPDAPASPPLGRRARRPRGRARRAHARRSGR